MAIPEGEIRHGIRSARTTITDVARVAGVAKGTVSRALSGHPDIAERTRLRIRKIAARMGYVPLSQAQAIRTGRGRAIGLVIQAGDHDAYRPFLAEFLAGLSAAAASEGWTLSVTTADDIPATLDRFQALRQERKADGFVLTRAMIDDPRTDALIEAEVPFVLYGRPHGRRRAPAAWFDFAGETAMAEAVGRFAALGHRRIAYVGGGTIYTYSALRRAGYEAGLQMAGLPLDPALIQEGVLGRAAGRDAAAALLASDDPPTAFLYSTDMAALGLWRAARDRGLQVGRDLAVIGYDGIPEGAHAEPPLSTYGTDARLAGERLGDLLIRRIRGAPLESLRETAPATFVDRGSLCPPPNTSGS
ncbi:MAG: LacI family DNA-binding transcriptional regulator [Pseudomonadota bacterium]